MEFQEDTYDDPRITAYVFDELELDEREAFERDMRASRELRRYVESLTATREKLRSEFARDRVSEVPLDARRAHSELPDVAGERGNIATFPQLAGSVWRSWLVAAVALGVIAIVAGLVVGPDPFAHLARVDTNHGSMDGDSPTRVDRGDAERPAQGDVDELVEMIERTVEPETWEGGEGSGTMEGFPTNLSLVVEQTQEVHPEPFGEQEVPDVPLTYPDATTWKALAERRSGSQSIDLNSLEKKPVEMEKMHLAAPTDGFRVTNGKLAGEARGLDDSGLSTAVGLDPVPRVPHADLDLGLSDNPFLPHEGRGPGQGGDQYDAIVENEFVRVTDAPLSTFSIDTDTASYSKIRSFIVDHHQWPRPSMVRIEEMINYFSYDYAGPEDERPFAAHLAATGCPWNGEHRLVRVALKGREMDAADRPASNLVFLLDVSGSMDQPNKFELMRRILRDFTKQLTENDRVAIVVYAGAAGLVLDSTTGDRSHEIEAALEQLRAGGSTNGGEGIALAYQQALDHFIPGGTNRVILCTDGDFNVGTTSTDALVELVSTQAKAGVFLSVLGFGTGNLNDALLEQITNQGNGNYAFIDSANEGRKVLIEQMAANLVVLAKDVKLQVEFNPKQVASYRLIGYENRMLAARDFNDDTKDAGEIGPGHTVTALYEIVPGTAADDRTPGDVDDLKYQDKSEPSPAADSGELLTLKVRYKAPESDTSELMSFALTDGGGPFASAEKEFQFAASVAAFGLVLRDSSFKGNLTLEAVHEMAASAASAGDGREADYRSEFVEIVRQGAALGSK